MTHNGSGYSKPGSGLCLLSLDAGGARTISILLILEAILKEIRKQENLERKAQGLTLLKGLPKPCEVFDLIGGTHLGGIIALLLGRLQFSIEEVIRRCTPPACYELLSTWTLDAELKRWICDVTEEPGLLLQGDSMGCAVFVCAQGFCDAEPTLPRSYDSADPSSSVHTIQRAARATSTTVIAGETYVDGNFKSYNPTKILLTEATKLFPGRLVASVVSLGTGHPLSAICLTHPSPTTLFSQIAADCEAIHEDVKKLSFSQTGLYHRFTVDQGMQGITAAEFSETGAAMAHTHAYLLTNTIRGDLTHCGTSLLRAQGTLLVEDLESRHDVSSVAPIPDQFEWIKMRLADRQARLYCSHDQGQRRCHPGTREVVLGKLYQWMQLESPDLDERPLLKLTSRWHTSDVSAAFCNTSEIKKLLAFFFDPPPQTTCCFITGCAGVGKTSIAMTIVHHLLSPLADKQPAGGSVCLVGQYFINEVNESADLDLLFPTIAVQLARNSPIAAKAIAQQNFPQRFCLEQAHNLFVLPFQALANEQPSKVFVVVIDGLDRLQPSPPLGLAESYSQAVEILGKVAADLPTNGRLLILSRLLPEDGDAASTSITFLPLETASSRPDVRTFFLAELLRIGKMTALPSLPTHTQLNELCEAAAGHLGWADLALRWLADVLVEQGLTAFGEEIKSFRGSNGKLDSLYRHILTRSTKVPIGPDATSSVPISQRCLDEVLVALQGLKGPRNAHAISMLFPRKDFPQVLSCLRRLYRMYSVDSNPFSLNATVQPPRSFQEFARLIQPISISPVSMGPPPSDELRDDLHAPDTKSEL